MEEKPYLKYSDKFKKLNLLSIIMHCVTIVTIIAFIFLPMFVCEREITEADFGGDLEKFMQYLQTLSPEELLSGKAPTITESFSMFDELMKNLSGLSGGESYDVYFSMLAMLFPLFTVIMGVILIVLSAKQLYEKINGYKNFESFCMLEYSSIKKSGEGREKKSFWKKQNIFAFSAYYVMAFVFGKVEASMYNISGAPFNVTDISYFGNAKISATIVVGIILLVANIILSVMVKKKKDEINLEITKEEFQADTEKPTV